MSQEREDDAQIQIVQRGAGRVRGHRAAVCQFALMLADSVGVLLTVGSRAGFRPGTRTLLSSVHSPVLEPATLQLNDVSANTGPATGPVCQYGPAGEVSLGALV